MTGQAGMTTLVTADGHSLDCWVEPAEGKRRGGIVLLQEIFGITDQMKSVARRYAAMGFDAAIPALFDRKEKGAVIPFSEGPRGRDLMLSLPLDQTMADIAAAIDLLAARGGKVAVIGFCWGGGLALRAAQLFDLAGAVGYYATRLPNYLEDDLKAPVLMHFGSQDDAIPADMRAAMQARFPQVEVHLYEAGHAFANDARPAYVDTAAATANARTVAFLDKVMPA